VEEAEGRNLRLTAVARDPEDKDRTYATARGRFVEAAK
jgi:hypothetical protein